MLIGALALYVLRHRLLTVRELDVQRTGANVYVQEEPMITEDYVRKIFKGLEQAMERAFSSM